MDSEISEKQKPLVLENQESKCDQQKNEQATQTESDDDQEQTKSALIDLKARIEELETEFLIRNLDYKELREEFNNFKMLILKSESAKLSKNIHLNETLANRGSFSDKYNFLPNLGEVSDDCYEDKHILFIHD